MHNGSHPKFLFLILVFLLLLCSALFGQKKGFAEPNLTKCWSYGLGDVAGGQIVSDGKRVFLGLKGARIEALSVDGEKIWSSEFGGEVTSNILATENGLFVVTAAVFADAGKTGDIRLRSVSKDTGITNWTVMLPEADGFFLNNSEGGIIVVSRNGTIQSIDAKQGDAKWKREIGESVFAEPVSAATNIIISTVGSQVIIISMATGEIVSMRNAAPSVTALAFTQNGVLIAGDERGKIYYLNGASKPLWSFKSGGQISSVFAIGENLLATSHDNYVYFLRSRNGSRVWKIRLTGRVSDVAIYRDAYAILSSIDERRTIVVDLKNGKIAGQILYDVEEVAVKTLTDAELPIFALTNKGLHAYGLNGCDSK